MQTSSLLALLLIGSVVRAATPSLLEAGSHCVAFKVERTSMMIHSSSVIGKNCDIAAQVLPDVGGIYRVEVSVPISGFKSGDEDRDQDISKTLKADVAPDLVFRSKGMTVEEWHKLLLKTDFDIAGELSIANKSYPLTMTTHYNDAGAGEIDGVAKVHFKDFNIEPPKIGGGIIAKIDQDIELHFHLLGGRILGADSIKPEAKPGTKATQDKEEESK